MNKKAKTIRNGILYTTAIALIVSGATMMEEPAHTWHAWQLILSGIAIFIARRLTPESD